MPKNVFQGCIAVNLNYPVKSLHFPTTIRICLSYNDLFFRINLQSQLSIDICYAREPNGYGQMEIVGKSIDGRMDYNQDRIFQSKKDGTFILAVADGMGGAGGGEIASQIVIDTCRERFELFSNSPDPGSLEKEITELVSLSQQRIRERYTKEADLKGMGTTLTIVLGAAEEYVVGNIGDSRTYLLSGGSLKQLT